MPAPVRASHPASVCRIVVVVVVTRCVIYLSASNDRPFLTRLGLYVSRRDPGNDILRGFLSVRIHYFFGKLWDANGTAWIRSNGFAVSLPLSLSPDRWRRWIFLRRLFSCLCDANFLWLINILRLVTHGCSFLSIKFYWSNWSFFFLLLCYLYAHVKVGFYIRRFEVRCLHSFKYSINRIKWSWNLSLILIKYNSKHQKSLKHYEKYFWKSFF